jgi:hypothetical protein
MSEHRQEPAAAARRPADPRRQAPSLPRLSDAQVGNIRNHLTPALEFAPIPARQAGDTHRVADEWAEAIVGLGGALHHYGLADAVRRDRPAPADTWLPWSTLKTEALAAFVLCLAVDHAEGAEIFRRARIADKVKDPSRPVPPAERERAAVLVVHGDRAMIAEVLANGVLLTDDLTFRRFADSLKHHVERLLPQPAEKGRQEQDDITLDHAGAADKTVATALPIIRTKGKGMADGEKPSGERGPKRSTEKGEARAKIIATLTAHHKYAGGGCLNQNPISVTKLARTSQAGKASASRFFKEVFGGHAKYRNVYCKDNRLLLTALKKLNGDYAVDELFGGTPPPKRKAQKREDDEE